MGAPRSASSERAREPRVGLLGAVAALRRRKPPYPCGDLDAKLANALKNLFERKALVAQDQAQIAIGEQNLALAQQDIANQMDYLNQLSAAIDAMQAYVGQ